MAYSFDITAAIKLTIDKMLFITTLLILCTDLKLFFNYLVRLSTTQEKHLMIDIMYLYQLYKRCKIAKVKQINRDSNCTDAITKSKLLLALK